MKHKLHARAFFFFLVLTSVEQRVPNVYDLTNEFSTKNDRPYASRSNNETMSGDQIAGGVDIASVVSKMSNEERTLDSLVNDIKEKEEEQETNRKTEQSLIINNSKAGTIVCLDHARNELEAIEGKSGIKLNATGRIQDIPSAGPFSVETFGKMQTEEEQETNRKTEQSLIINNSKAGTIVSLDHARNELEAIEGKSGIKLNATGRIQDIPSAGPFSVMDNVGGAGPDPMGVVDDAWMTYENVVSLPVRLKSSGDVVPIPMTKAMAKKKKHSCKKVKRKSRILFCA